MVVQRNGLHGTIISRDRVASAIAWNQHRSKDADDIVETEPASSYLTSSS